MRNKLEAASAPSAAPFLNAKQKKKKQGEAGGPHATGLVPLADYRSPAMPVERVARAVWTRIKRRFDSSSADPVRAENRLQATTLQALQEVVGKPACGPLFNDFDAAVGAWLAEPGGTFHCVVVLPPCDPTDLIGTWAQSRGHTILCAPAWEQDKGKGKGKGLSIIAGTDKNAKTDATTDDGITMAQGDASVIVIPRLELWFLRQRNGLDAVRALLAELQQSERRCLIGCNSWAWAFLVRAAGAALVLPSPRTLVAFDAERLRAWFSELARQTGSDRAAFRLASSGADVLATNEDGVLANNYLQELAARSHGIPWVAWHLWRSALRTGIDANQASTVDAQKNAVETQANPHPEADVSAVICPKNGVHGDERIFWVTGVPDPDLPHHQDDNALLVLHALLIHGALDRADLLSVLPDATVAEVLPALLRNEFIERQGDRLAVKPSAYPAARRALLTAGFPVGDI